MALPKYSKNPEDWFVNCSNPICEEKIIYTNRKSFTQVAKKIKDGHSVKCRSCAASGYKHTDEAKEKMSNRIHSEESRKKKSVRNKERYANMTEEERKEVSETQKRANRKYWDSLTEVERIEAGRRMVERMNNISEEKKALKAQKISEAKIDPNGMNHNPETWKVNCTRCESEIKFEKYHQFQNAKSEIKNGKKKLCANCKVKNLKVIKTDNPDDWVKKCCDCDNVLKYSTFESYRTRFNKETRCKDCNAAHLKTIIPKLREYSRNFEDWVVCCADCKESVQLNTLSYYQTIMKRLKDGKTYTCRTCYYKTTSNGYDRPNYNKDTIPYIVDILNVRYDTEFIHAESKYGEYFIFDDELGTRYYADAYSEELNMWVEFDEPAHFRKGILNEECQKREQRIRDLIPDVIINRVYFNKNNHNINRNNNIGEY